MCACACPCVCARVVCVCVNAWTTSGIMSGGLGSVMCWKMDMGVWGCGGVYLGI